MELRVKDLNLHKSWYNKSKERKKKSFKFDDIFHAMRQFNIHNTHLSHNSSQNLHTQLSYIKTTKKTYFSLCCLSESVTQRRPDINFSRENTSAEKNVTNKNYLLTEGKLS